MQKIGLVPLKTPVVPMRLRRADRSDYPSMVMLRSGASRRWALIIAAYGIAALFFSGQKALVHAGRGASVDWGAVFGSELVYWAIWLALTPAILAFARRHRVEAPHRMSHLAGHVVFGAIVAAIQIATWKSLDLVLFSGLPVTALADPPAELTYAVLVGGWTSYFKYGVIVGIEHAIEVQRRYRNREREAMRFQVRSANLEAELTRTQLEALRKQLEPHFLFNTLNTISVLMEEDVTRARRMLLRLGELLRLTLEYDDDPEIALDREIAFLSRYLDVERERFEDRLTIEIDVAPETRNASVPTLILQPLVENAIRHGIAPRARSGHVAIRARRRDHELHLEVEDDGGGIPPDARPGVGFRNTRSRLARLHDGRARLELRSADGRGTVARVVLPFRDLQGARS